MKVPGLRAIRERRGLTQRELAEVAGVAKRSIAGWESGESIRPGSAGKVAEALGVAISDLCEERIEATIMLPYSSHDERTEQLLAMLRRYEEMAEGREHFDFSAADLRRLSGDLATELIYGASHAADRGDHRSVTELLRRARPVLSWLQRLVAESEEREARALADIKDPLEIVAQTWSELNRARSKRRQEKAARLARVSSEHEKEGKSDG